ncbi:CpsB/CapC family capsule biosynthesis tyrosine phosphatase [Hymenobacter sp. ASUV-10]|uniref:protein-tyrosine-phosphatase n=1 Tax=Hymenobacter aranciens TaxID=3063996 RepID=A0ABT9BC35_9BACT|nr:CpsB/CapC family capsule biosynthesis tyrosine phosphatase [Hymenobacter sp. ASUV-10]MDO7875259.1 CpsB/CapC family capsule biosynthesis tyrosine phosphatase [Hymenobacter sp. ASUV-10]
MASFWRKLFGGGESAAPTALVESLAVLGADMHSHLLPGLDDGAETIEHSLDLLRAMRALGYRKLVMTPHIMGDFYKNTPEGIRAALKLLTEAAAAAGLGDVELGCAAEYYLDEFLGRKLADGTEMLTFGGDKRYLLFETSYMNEPLNLMETVFELKSQGYQPVLAHPERYTYLYGRFSEIEKLRQEYGVLMQLNINSLVGYYSPAAQKVAEQLVDGGLVDFVGSDAHHLRHTNTLQTKVLRAPYLQKLLQLPLRNNQLLSS